MNIQCLLNYIQTQKYFLWLALEVLPKSFMTNILMAKNLNYALTWHILHYLKIYLIYK